MIEFKNITKHFLMKKNSVHALNDVSFQIDDGEIFGIVGFSGAGKSTLVRMINGLEKPSSGQVLVDGNDLGKLNKKELRAMRKQIGMVFQQFNLLNSKTVYENVAMPLILNKEDKQVIDKRVKEMLAFVELSDKLQSYPDQLSGGQKQRVGIARALAMNPKILLCDEATSALDPKTTDSILDLLKKINDDLGITIVIITHEMHVIEKICDHVAVMEKGSVIETGKVQDVFSAPQQAITKDFINMVVKEDVPEGILKNLQYSPETSQIWSIKYWGANQTVEIVESLEKTFGKNVRIAYVTTSLLQEHTLNILIVLIDTKEDIAEKVAETMTPYQVLLERKEYEC